VATVLSDVLPDGAEYRAASEAAGLFDRSERGKLALSGADAPAFLDALVSNAVAELAPGTGVDATLLTNKGQMLAELRVLRTQDEVLLDCERPCLQALFDALRQFQIGYAVELHKRTLECALLSLIGPGADDCVAVAPAVEEYANCAGELAGAPVRLIRTDVGVDVLCESAALDAVRGALVDAGAVPIGAATAECIRIESGRPRFGAELDTTTMPQEAGIHERAVSYSKGCYIGQETVARLYWKGKPNRLLRGLRFSEAVAVGAELRGDDDAGGRVLGLVAGATVSPRFGPIGLALVRREAGVGTVLNVGGAGADVHASIVELPFAAAPTPL
jgi:folate-binding protein YgfZ